MKETTNEKIAKIIKNLDALSHLFNNISYNYLIFYKLYQRRAKDKDMEFKRIEFAFNNFILVSSILREYIKSFEKDFTGNFTKTKIYNKTKDILLKDESYLMLLGLRNYLQHVFHFQLAFGNLLSKEDDLFLSKIFMLKHKDLHTKKLENQVLNNFFKDNMVLPIMFFSDKVMYCMIKFYDKFQKIIHSHYKKQFEKYNSCTDDNYAFDMHNIYLNNLQEFNENNH